MELLWRLFVAVVVILGPTVLFLGLWRGLMRMRNGEFVQRVCAQMDETPEGIAIGAPARGRRARSSSPALPPLPVGRVRCGRCGEENVGGYDYCRECQAQLGGD